MPLTPSDSDRRRKTPPNDLDLNKLKSIDDSSSSGESNNFDSSQDCNSTRDGDSTNTEKAVEDARKPSDETKFAFYATVDEQERCEEHLKLVTDAYERWLEALKPVKDEAGLVCLNLCSMMKAFHTAILDAIRAENFFSNFQQEAQKLEEEMITFNKGDKTDTTNIKKVIDNMYRHFRNQCSSGNPCAVAEGGDKELLRYGDLAMKKLFEQTKHMSSYMTDVVHMIEKKISLEMEYNRQLHKMSTDHRSSLENMQQSLPFIDILESLMMDENDYSNNMLSTYDKLMQERFVKPLKARIRDLDDASQELYREWSKKKAAYEKAKDNTKEAYSRYHKACVEVDREVAKGQAPDRQARVLEKEGNKKKYWDEFEECRKHQKISFEELCKKREWILAATLNVVGQAEKKLQSAVGHLLSSLTSGFQQRPVYHRSLFIESLSKALCYNESIVYDILYLDSEVARTPKDLETEFEDKDNPFEREDPPPRQTAKPPVQPRDVKQPENASNGLMGWFTSNFKSAHTFEKLAADDTRYLTKCMECHVYVYEGQVCSKCNFVIHHEHLVATAGPLKYPTCDLAKAKPPPELKYFRNDLKKQPKAENGDPLFLSHCLPLVEKAFMKEHGLYRQEGVRKKASQLCNDIEDNITKVTAETVADHKVISLVIKHYIRTIPKSLLEENFFHNWMTLGADIVKSEERGERIPTHVVPGIKYNLKQIDPLNRRAAMMLFDHLRKIASFSHFNNMNSTNLGIVFGPNLIRKAQPQDHSMGLDQSNTWANVDVKDNKEHTDYLKSVTSFMIDNFDEVFNDDVMNTSSGAAKRDSCTSAGGAGVSGVSSSRVSQVSTAESDGTYVTVDPLHAATFVSPSDTFSSLSSAGGLSPSTPKATSNDRFYSDEPSTLGGGRPRLCDMAALETVQSDPNVNNSDQNRKGFNGVTRSANDLR